MWDEFAFRDKQKNLKRSECKKCFNPSSKKHYNLNKTSYIETKKRSRDKSKEFVLDFLETQKCIDCGSDDLRVLEFDHFENKKCGVSLMTMKGYSIETVKKEIEKCIVRCRNCHVIKTHKERDSLRHRRWLSKQNKVI